MSTEFWIQMVVYGVSIGGFAAGVLTRLHYLEKKMDKHNGLMDRMTKAESKIENYEYRINKMECGGSK